MPIQKNVAGRASGGSTPGWTTVDLRLHMRLEDIPDAPPCQFCGAQPEKQYIPHRLLGTHTMVRIEKAAGYWCRECDLTSLSDVTLNEAVARASDMLRTHGDSVGAERLQRSLWELDGATEAGSAGHSGIPRRP